MTLESIMATIHHIDVMLEDEGKPFTNTSEARVICALLLSAYNDADMMVYQEPIERYAKRLSHVHDATPSNVASTIVGIVDDIRRINDDNM